MPRKNKSGEEYSKRIEVSGSNHLMLVCENVKSLAVNYKLDSSYIKSRVLIFTGIERNDACMVTFY